MPELNSLRGYRTPNINEFATQGMRLNRMYTEPLCTPSRVAFMTGRQPFRMGMGDNGHFTKYSPASGYTPLIFRGGKGDTTEGGVRVDAFVRWPGMIKAHAVVGDIVHITDLYTSLARMAGADGWVFDAALYLWGASINGDTSTGQEIEIGLSDILSNLDMAMMLNLDASHGKWRLNSDIIYMNISAKNGNDSLTVRPDLPASTESKVSMKAWIVTPGVNYNVLINEHGNLDVMLGARFLSLDIGIKNKAQSALGSRTTVKASDSGSAWDGVVGLNGKINLSGNWGLRYYGDIGTGQSDLTWQGYAVLVYQFKHVDAGLGYRYLKWNFDETAGLDNLILKGPQIGIRYQF
jgi:hypothetical protein